MTRVLFCFVCWPNSKGSFSLLRVLFCSEEISFLSGLLLLLQITLHKNLKLIGIAVSIAIEDPVEK